MRAPTSTGAVLSPPSPGGLESLDPRVAAQLLHLGFDAARSPYTAEEIVQATVGAALTIQGFLQRTQAEVPLQQAA